MKKIIGIVLTAVLSLSMFFNIGVAGAYADTKESKAYSEAPLLLETIDSNYYGFKKIAETDNLAMYIMEANVSLAILSKTSGTIWASTVNDNELKTDGYLAADGSAPTAGAYVRDDNGEYYDSSLDKFRSIFTLYSVKIESSASLSEATWYSAMDLTLLRDAGGGGDYVNEEGYYLVDYDSIANGVRIKIRFGQMNVQLTADFSLNNEDDTLVVKVENRDDDKYDDAQDGVRGDGSSQYSKFVAFSVLPYFGAATDRDSGYVFLPDGSGAIADFNVNHTNAEYKTSMKVYAPSTHGANGLFQLERAESEGIMPVLYPVYGLKKNNDAFFAIITDGSEYSTINYSPSGSGGNYNLVYTAFYVRQIRMTRSDPASAGYYVAGSKIAMFDEGAYGMEYHFYSGDDANYSGFAKTYRDYLLKNDMLNDAISDDDEMPLALDIFMNTYTEGIFGNQSVIMTDFDQASDMIKKLNEAGVTDMLINMSAWQKNGISYGQVTPIYSKLGGISGLKKFTSLANSFGYEVFMQVNVVEADDDTTTKFRVSRDAAKDMEDLAMQSRTYSGNLYTVAPVRVLERYSDIYYSYFKDTGISGFNYERLAYYLFEFSYAQVHYDRSDTKELFTNLLKESKEDFGKNAVWYGNDYSLAYADWIYDLPSTDTGYPNMTRSVPFAQMVLHGYIPYTSIAGNTFYDETQQTLKWIEYGYIPYYKLADAETGNLLGTNMSELFSAEFDYWSDRVVEKYNLFKDEFGSLYTQTMVRHDKIQDNVFVTEYSDGTKVYVNYGEFNVSVGNGNTVESMNYLIVKG